MPAVPDIDPVGTDAAGDTPGTSILASLINLRLEQFRAFLAAGLDTDNITTLHGRVLEDGSVPGTALEEAARSSSLSGDEIVTRLEAQVGDTRLTASAIRGLVPFNSPAFTGNPTVPTQLAGNSSTRASNTEFVTDAIATAIATLVGTAPVTLDTIQELSAFLQSESDLAAVLMTTLAAKLATNAKLSDLTTVTVSTEDPSGGEDGDFWFKYTA